MLDADLKLPEVIDIDVAAGEYPIAAPLPIGTLDGEPIYLSLEPFRTLDGELIGASR